MEQTAQETLTAQMPVQSNGGITSHEEITGHNEGTRQEGSDLTQIPAADEAVQRARVFGEIVALLSFSPVFKHLSLGDLEWLVIPGLGHQPSDGRAREAQRPEWSFGTHGLSTLGTCLGESR